MTDNPILVRISDSGLTVPDEQEIRGRHVVDPDGEQLGTVGDLLVDEEEERVRFLEVTSGGFLGIGQEKVLIPVDAVTRIDDQVHVSTSRSHVEGSPGYDPELAAASPLTYYGGLYGYYGMGPYWGQGYVYPGGVPL
ncbi:PRC-barrel domain-containing protein [Sanguibacter sp. 25GB23B1]|uniref:PRC-barrel domain-containing protein n=1 Tax=unclassified Sanguibacter TaxID=2645534 RepID=UPI0032AF86E9